MLKKQYELVKNTRGLLFQFCEKMSPDDYTKELEGFGWGSVRNLHTHVAECYQNWLGKFGLKENIQIADPTMVRDVSEIRQIFKKVDELVYRFLNAYGDNYEHLISGPVSWQEDDEELSVLWLFTHTLTHEFHHKGQIVTMGRQLGYIPDDTDLITPTDLKTLF
ncbi:DinB family protein [Virgibacillus doumboii]|uniref:DinB family protein n=1 Tax=Virgibacillus doumboii TaxID=2697503 RepID=UPI001FE77638|nr:DinB family protein [Virgibacillus doumboii]